MRLTALLLCMCLGGCALVDRIMNTHGAPDPRPALGPGDRITVTRRELGNYRCAEGVMICESWRTTFECRCPQ